MTIQLSAMLGPAVMYERLRTAQNHRDPRVHTHTHTMPVGRETARPAWPDALAALCSRSRSQAPYPAPVPQQPALPRRPRTDPPSAGQTKITEITPHAGP